MTLPHVGASLGETLEGKSRRYSFDNIACPRCGKSPFPRGWVANIGVCWTCLRSGDGKDRQLTQKELR